MDKKRAFNQITVSYDREADVLYMSEGKRCKAVCKMLDEGIIVRKDPKTKEIVGFTIVDFISHFSKLRPQSLPIGAKFSLLQTA
ncbi:MAG: DUF2283 domain-containing protein [Candidatus Omnitrophica bacterium]|nr:DUF2283 domain-containing protein [Candidatus Omnitrophota bacterium]